MKHLYAVHEECEQSGGNKAQACSQYGIPLNIVEMMAQLPLEHPASQRAFQLNQMPIQ